MPPQTVTLLTPEGPFPPSAYTATHGEPDPGGTGTLSSTFDFEL